MTTKTPASWERHLRACAGPLPAGYKRVAYPTARTAKTEGGLYEQITGHRSPVLDAADAKCKV